MYLKTRDTDGVNKWFLRGIVSVSLLDTKIRCDLMSYVVFTDLSKLGDWIPQVTGISQPVRRRVL